MFVLNRTHARWAFKDLLGQANHFLITILVGLNGVRKNKIEFDDEFRTSWNPKSALRSAERSRVFALDLSLIRAIDALDTYFILSVRKPCALLPSFVSAMDGTGRSVAKRLNVFDCHLPQLRESHKVALEVAIEWRNRRVHSLSDDRIDKAMRKTLTDDAKYFEENHSGLNIKELLSHFDASLSPTFKEAASIIALCHEAVRVYDAKILEQLHVTQYVSDAVLILLEQGCSDLTKPIMRVWNNPKRETKALRILRLSGVSESDTVTGREVPSAFVERFVSLRASEAEQFLRDEAAAVHA